MGKIKDFFYKQEPWYLAFFRDILISFLVMGIIFSGIYLYAGVWPPMVAVESGSMEPNINVGDVIFVKHEEVITSKMGQEKNISSFGRHGEVVVYDLPNDNGPPIIHRALYFVEEGDEMWEGGLEAPHSGYITKGDNNDVIDQKSHGIAYGKPIKEEWIKGVAKYRIPLIGKIRLMLGEITSSNHPYHSAIQYQHNQLLPQLIH